MTDSATSFDGNELASRVYQQRGHVVMGSTGKHRIGSVIYETKCPRPYKTSTVPLRVVAQTTREDFLEQDELICSMIGVPRVPFTTEIYFYRVEAVD